MTALFLSHSVPPIIRGAFTVPYIAVENILACKVFRDVKLGLIDPYPSTQCTTLSRFNAAQSRYLTGVSDIVFGSAPCEATGVVGGRELRVNVTVHQWVDTDSLDLYNDDCRQSSCKSNSRVSTSHQ